MNLANPLISLHCNGYWLKWKGSRKIHTGLLTRSCFDIITVSIDLKNPISDVIATKHYQQIAPQLTHWPLGVEDMERNLEIKFSHAIFACTTRCIFSGITFLWTPVRIGFSFDLVLSGYKPSPHPELTKIYVAILHQLGVEWTLKCWHMNTTGWWT